MFLPNGPEGAFEQTMVMVVGPPVEFQNRLHLYYSATKGSHGSTNRTRAIGLATMRPDGYAALEPKGREGSMTTKPFRVAGKKLLVNADAARGAVSVEVLDASGRVRPGFGVADAQPLTTDELAHAVSWKSRDLSSLVGEVVRLRFRVRKAKVYAFRLQ